ncbi:hypothetical protein AGIG_G7589 [Arapaima gigas]
MHCVSISLIRAAVVQTWTGPLSPYTGYRHHVGSYLSKELWGPGVASPLGLKFHPVGVQQSLPLQHDGGAACVGLVHSRPVFYMSLSLKKLPQGVELSSLRQELDVRLLWQRCVFILSVRPNDSIASLIISIATAMLLNGWFLLPGESVRAHHTSPLKAVKKEIDKSAAIRGSTVASPTVT